MSTNSINSMKVVKRDGEKEEISFDKIIRRVKNLSNDLNVDPIKVAQRVIESIFDGITTSELDELSAETACSLSTEHPDYGMLAGRISISNHQKNTPKTFYRAMKTLYDYTDIHGKNIHLISNDFYEVVKKHKKELEEVIDYERDFGYDYFGFKTLQRSYLMKAGNEIVERIQHMWMRVAIGLHGDNLEKIYETYNLMSQKYFTHATPTLFNAGTNRPQLSSCFLIHMKDDSINGIFDTLKECALISKWAGGIGLHIHNIRANGSRIRGTNGTNNGIVPMLKVFNNTATYVNQSGKRNGSFAIYLEPHHADIEDFLEMRKNHGDESKIARDLFYALWISDLFMKRVENNEMWSLMCPDECPGLSDVYGEEYEKLYTKYESAGKYRKQIEARKLWERILIAQIETGTPYMLYKDACNIKCNQKNLGTIKSSNLCCEITLFTSPEETAVCNLASINLTKFVKDDNSYDFDKLHSVTKVITKNLNKVIDINYYPVEEARVSNMKHRPIGIGVQGLADVFCLMRHPFESDEAKQLNKDIFETIYHAALEASCEEAESRENEILEYKQLSELNSDDKEIRRKMNRLLKKNKFSEEELTRTHACGAYDSYLWNNGSPFSNDILQFDMWNVKPSERWNWKTLRESIKKFGVRNSMLTAPMPTAGTSQILGNYECFEPLHSNMYTRRTLAGEFLIINKYLMKDLIELKLWNDEMKYKIMAHEGSIQNIDEIPDNIKALYKTVWEIKMRNVIDMAADRGAYIDQSQSMNLFTANPSISVLTSMQFYAWKKGLKTGQYYLRTKPVARAQQFTVDPSMVKNRSLNINDTNNHSQNSPVLKSVNEPKKQIKACLRDNPDCESCGA